MNKKESESINSFAAYARSGKDGLLYSEDGKTLLATVDQFTSKANFANLDYKPLGVMVGQKVPNGVTVTLTFSQYVVEDDQLFEELMEFINTGTLPKWNFVGVLNEDGYTDEGKAQRIVYSNCVPDGEIDLQNITPGELVKRSWTFSCNSAPCLQDSLKLGL